MSSRRTLILIASLAIGAIAALLVFRYVNGVEERAKGDQQVTRVLVAAQSIPEGGAATKLIETGGVSLQERRIAEIPKDAINRPEDIKGQESILPISPGTIITASMFSAPGTSANSNADTLENGMVAVTTSTDSVRGVANLLRVGDYVNLTYIGVCADGQINNEGSQSGGDTAEGGGAKGTKCAISLYQKVKILAIGQDLGAPTASAEGEEETVSKSDLITFEVPPKAAQEIAYVGPGSLYMTLVSPDYKPIPLAPSLEPLPAPGALGETPYGVDPEAKETDG